MTLRSSAAAAPPASVASVTETSTLPFAPAARLRGVRPVRARLATSVVRPPCTRLPPDAASSDSSDSDRASTDSSTFGVAPAARAIATRLRTRPPATVNCRSSSISRSGVDVSRAFSADSGGVSGRCSWLDRDADLHLDRRQRGAAAAACRRTAARRPWRGRRRGLGRRRAAPQLGEVDRLGRQLGLEVRARLQLAQRGAAVDRLAGEREVERIGAQLAVAPAQGRAQVQGQGQRGRGRRRAGPGRPRR